MWQFHTISSPKTVIICSYCDNTAWNKVKTKIEEGITMNNNIRRRHGKASSLYRGRAAEMRIQIGSDVYFFISKSCHLTAEKEYIKNTKKKLVKITYNILL